MKIRIRGFPAQSATFERKADAKNWAAQTESALREGRYLIRRVLTRLTLRVALPSTALSGCCQKHAAKKYTVGDLIARYFEHQKNRNQARALDVGAHLAWWATSFSGPFINPLHRADFML